MSGAKAEVEDSDTMDIDANNLTALLLSAEDAATLLGVSRRHFYGLHSSGRLGPLPVKLGRSVKWVRAELEAWAAARCPIREEWVRLQGNEA